LWSKFLRRNFLLEIFFAGTLFLRIVKKNPAKIAKIRTRKNLVPHGGFAVGQNYANMIFN